MLILPFFFKSIPGDFFIAFILSILYIFDTVLNFYFFKETFASE